MTMPAVTSVIDYEAVASSRGGRLGPLREVWPLWPGLVLLVLAFALPLLLIFPESVSVKGRLSTAIYRSIARDSYYWSVIGRSFWLSLVSTLICLCLAYPVAYYLVRVVRPSRARFAYMIVIAPLFTSAVIRAMAWLTILGRRGIVNDALAYLGLIAEPLRMLYTEEAVVVGLVYIMIPFMVLTIAAVLENVDGTLEEASRDLGASPWVTFWRVTFPLSVPGVLAGCFLVFALCLSSYVTPALLGGGRHKVIAMLIFEQFMRTFNWPLGAALACVLLIATLLIVWGYNRALSRRFTTRHRVAGAAA
ncbi:MAG TPA: ABC transporter permease [Alphaproteobacteria bacterium]|nr:ABC transporter permease [Alphaproteobacteria bacterium]